MKEKWTDLANCKDTDPGIFYHNQIDYDLEALKICVDCPVMDACLLHALANHENGVWGGTTEGERRRMRVNSYAQGVPVTSLRRKILRVQTHLANVSPSPPSYKPSQQMNSQVPFGPVVVLPLVCFG